MALAGRTITGARCKLLIRGVEVGFATGISISENIQQQPIDILGEIDSVEIEPTGRSVSMTANLVRIKGETVQSLGIWPKVDGGTVEAVNFPAMDALILDSVDDSTVLYKVEGLKCQSRSLNVDARGVFSLNVSFIGLRMFDETNA
tara:strand:- start:79 stop:516 length:438 start_codon:yes stop_codon:yes gene_type:complete